MQYLYSFKYLLSTYYVPRTAPGNGNIMLGKTDIVAILMEFIFWWGGGDIQQTGKQSEVRK